jgi:hypothetical protein
MPCSNGSPGADPPRRSVTMAYREAASPAPGPSRKSEMETSRYAVVESTACTPPYSPAFTHSARSHTHCSASSGTSARPASSLAGACWCLLVLPGAPRCSSSSQTPRRCIYSLFRRRGALASSFLLPTLVDALSLEPSQCGSGVCALTSPAPSPYSYPSTEAHPPTLLLPCHS